METTIWGSGFSDVQCEKKNWYWMAGSSFGGGGGGGGGAMGVLSCLPD